MEKGKKKKLEDYEPKLGIFVVPNNLKREVEKMEKENGKKKFESRPSMLKRKVSELKKRGVTKILERLLEDAELLKKYSTPQGKKMKRWIKADFVRLIESPKPTKEIPVKNSSSPKK